MKWSIAAAVLSLDKTFGSRESRVDLATVFDQGSRTSGSDNKQSQNSQQVLERRPFAGVQPRRSRIDENPINDQERNHRLESTTRLRSRKNKNTKPQHQTECNPSLQDETAPDVGVLECGIGEYCMESDQSSSGGFCVDESVAHEERHGNLKWFSFLNPSRESTTPLGVCDPWGDESGCDPGQECMESQESATGGVCIENSKNQRKNVFSGFRRQLQYYPYTLFYEFIEYACDYETLICECTSDATNGATVISCSYSPPCVLDYVTPCLEESKVVDVCNALEIDATGTGPTDFKFKFCYGYTSPFTMQYCYEVISNSGLLTCSMTMGNEQCVSCDLDTENVCIVFDCTNTAFGTAGNLCKDPPLPDLAFMELLNCYGACNICGEGGRISNYGYDVSPKVNFLLDCYFTPLCSENQILCEDIQHASLLGGLIGSDTCKIAPDVDIYTDCCIETSSPEASPTPQISGCESHNFDCFSCIENDCYWCPGDALCSNMTDFQDEYVNVFDRQSSCPTPEDYTTDTCTEPENFFSDPAYSAQKWIFDMIRVQVVWEKGYRGKGVNVRVNDEGIEADHPEFEGRINADASCTGQIQPLSSAFESGFSHGTAVASIVGAGADNAKCGVGIAPEVSLSSCYINSQRTFTQLFTFKLEAIDISQNSWGRPACYEEEAIRRLQQAQCPFTYSESHVFPCLYCDFNNLQRGDCIEAIEEHCQYYFREDRIACLEHLDLALGVICNFQTISDETEMAFKRGVTEGRDGNGVIYVFASGNDLFNGGDTNFEGIGTNTRFAISVGAVGKDGLVAFYSTSGASQFVTAPGGDIANSVTNIVTASLDGGCTDAGQGTSFAAPVVSGVIALMLEANPNLTWRDVQSIIATTSQRVDDDLDHTDVVNAASIWHSNFYGFGIIDAAAAVEAAESWEFVGPERNVTQSSPLINLLIPDDENQPIVSSIEVNVTNKLTIESVYLYLRLEHSSRGHLQVKLTSPSGTESIVSPGRRPENTQISELGWWQMMTVTFWGETPNGQWNLSVVDLKDGHVTAEEACASYEWLFADKITCLILEEVEYCANGQVDPYNYAQAYGDYSSIFSFRYIGLTAEEACCVCGGGVNDINSLSDSLIEWKLTIFGEGSMGDEPMVTPSPSTTLSITPTSSPTATPSESKLTNPPTPILIPSPTLNPNPVEILAFNATGDTFFLRKILNPLTNQPSPQEQTMLVQKGETFNPDAFALLSFPDKDLAGSVFGMTSLDATPKIEIKTSLCLHHVPNSEAMNFSTYTVCRLTKESYTSDDGNSFDLEDPDSNKNDDLLQLRIPDDCMGTESDMIEFNVAPNDDRICVEISSLMKLSSPAPENRQAHPIIFENKQKVMMFIIDNLGPAQAAGDEFYTMNSLQPPQLVFAQVDVDPNAPENTPTSPPSHTKTEIPSAPPSATPPPSKTFTQPSSAGVDIDDSRSNKNYLYALLGLLVLCPLLYVCVQKAKKFRGKNGDKQQTASCDTSPTLGGQSDFTPSDVLFVPTADVHWVSPQSVDDSQLQQASARFIDEEDDDDDDDDSGSESDGEWESELNGDDEGDSEDSSSESSHDQGTNDTFDDEGLSDDDDEILLHP